MNIKCEMCGKKIESDSYYRFCAKCTRLRDTDKYLYFGIAIALIGFVSGIVCGGWAFASENEDFNFGIMIGVWISFFIFDIFVF